MSAKQRNKGFTLIELVVVIAILAILAAFALPRFAQLSEQAHVSSVKGTAGALSASVALVKAQWVTNGTTGAVNPVEGFGENDVAATAQGWPDPGVSGGCTDLWGKLLQSNAPIVAPASSPTDSAEYLASASGNECTYVYQLDGQAGTADEKRIVYNADTGAVTAVNE